MNLAQCIFEKNIFEFCEYYTLNIVRILCQLMQILILVLCHSINWKVAKNYYFVKNYYYVLCRKK